MEKKSILIVKTLLYSHDTGKVWKKERN